MRLIDADELIKRVDNDTYIWEHRKNHVRCMIQTAPTIDAVPVVHGEWISDRLCSTNGGTYGVRRCSKCESYYQDIGYGWNFCPNCGAKMDGKEQEDE